MILCFEAGSSRGTLQRKICYTNKSSLGLGIGVIPGVDAVGLVTIMKGCARQFGELLLITLSSQPLRLYQGDATQM